MKVSILVTTYNIEHYIDAAINSIVSQEMPFEWELLVGDDGSDDGTADRINKWIDIYPNNIRLFVHTRDGSKSRVGSRAAKNRAFLLERAQGEYIQFFDGDDLLLDNQKIRSQVELLDDPKYASCSCCGHNMEVFVLSTGEKRILTIEKPGDAIYNIKEYWGGGHYYSTDTLLFRRECIQLLLHPLNRDFLNDNFITFLLLQFGDIYYLDKVWARYNQTGEGLWTGHSTMYGDFRNIHLYDLELKVRPDLSTLIMNRHKFSIRNIQRNYKQGMEEEIQPLLKGLDPGVFKYTLLLAKLEGLTLKEKWAKFMLFKKADISYMVSRVKKLFGK